MYNNNAVEIKTETSVPCSAGVGVLGEGFTVPNVLSRDFNLFARTHTYHY